MRLFTALIAAGGQSVSDDQLAETTWGLDAPVRASPALQVYVSPLRQSLRGDRQQLERRGSGYALRLAPDATDVTWFTLAHQGITRSRRARPPGGWPPPPPTP
jgi:DNA-binding SARP family transcriptional activator